MTFVWEHVGGTLRLEEFYLFEDLLQGRIVAFHNQLLAVAEVLADEEVLVVGDSQREVVVLGVPTEGAGAVGHGEEFQTAAGEEHLYQRLAFFLPLGFHLVEEGRPVAVVEEEAAEDLLGGEALVGGFAGELGGEILGEGLQGADAAFVEGVHLTHLGSGLAGQGLWRCLRRIED